MLNTLSPSIAPSSLLGSPRPQFPDRRRGGQPYNSNAFKHGIYTHPNPTSRIKPAPSTKHAPKLPFTSGQVYLEILHDLRMLLHSEMEECDRARGTRFALAWDRWMRKTFRLILRYRSAYEKHMLPMRNLHKVSIYCLELIRLNIDDLGISQDLDSFRGKLEDADLTSFAFQESFCASLSDPPYPFLTPRQWRVLAPLLPPPVPIRRRGRPSIDPRELLDAVFWKLAHKACWQDLPDYYPPMLSCRRYYRRLFLSGRLTTLLSALYQDLLARGEVTPTRIVDQGMFLVTENSVTLPQRLNEIWQLRTSLLFLQLGYQAFRRFARAAKLHRRFGYTSCRALLMGNFKLKPSLIKYSESSFIPIDLSFPGSGPCERTGIRSANSLQKVTLIRPSAPELQVPFPISAKSAPLFPAGGTNNNHFY